MYIVMFNYNMIIIILLKCRFEFWGTVIEQPLTLTDVLKN